jgi:hypothetical protein
MEGRRTDHKKLYLSGLLVAEDKQQELQNWYLSCAMRNSI